MDSKTCQQCHQVTNVTFNRMVRDSCGHEKCRMCLLRDDTKCLACLENFAIDNSTQKEILNDKHKVNSQKIIAISNQLHSNKPIDKELEIRLQPNESIVTLNKEVNTFCVSEKSKHKRTVITKRNIEFTDSDKPIKDGLDIIQTLNSIENPIKRSPRKSIPNHIIVEKCTSSDKQYYTCTVCKRKFRCRSQISFHVHCNSTNPFTCTICQQKFSNFSHFTVHMNIHYGNKIFVCDTCSDSFHQKSKLIRHLFVHSGLRPYKCTLCDAKFSTSVSLKRHGTKHSLEKPHECKTCGKRFRDISNLKQHESKHSGIRYTCTECGKQFTVKSSLRMHMKRHSKDRPETCSHCPNTFYSKRDKMRHELTHLEVKQFQCLLCDIKCRRKDNLVRHFRNTHPDIDRDNIINNSIEMKTPEKNIMTINVKQKKQGRKLQPVITDKAKMDDTEKAICENSDVSENTPEKSDNRECIVQDTAVNVCTVETITLSRSEILEANNKRQSVIFNSKVLKIKSDDKKSLPTTFVQCDNNAVVDNSTNVSTLDENSSPRPSLEIVSKPVQPAFTIVPPSAYLNSTKYKINDISNIHRRNENTIQYSDAYLTQKKTIDINQAYKQLFNRVKPHETSQISNVSTRNYDDGKNDLKVNNVFDDTSQNNRRYMQNNITEDQYDHKKYSSEYKYYSSGNMLHNTSSFYKTQMKFACSTKSFLHEDNEQATDFSPESIELYKKILIPSYKGSNETNITGSNRKEISSNCDNTSNESNLLPASVIKEDVSLPPLVPIDKDNSKTFNESRLLKSDSQSRDNAAGNLTAINDVHWRRRLALNSSHDD